MKNTNIILILFLFLFVHCQDIYYNHSNLDNNLYFVFTTFRHGARSVFHPIDYFGNPIKSQEALSKYGAIQHLEIGQKYRKRYSNFLNMSFDKNEFYIRSSNIERTIISTEKQLEGLFNKTIGRNNFQIVQNGINFWNLFHLNNTEHQETDKYFKFCKNKRKLGPNYGQIFNTDIFPILQNCYNMSKSPNLYDFCDSVYTAYFEYTYNNDTNNKIGKCGNEIPK